MKAQGLSEKERALLEAARREAAAAKKAPAPPKSAAGRPTPGKPAGASALARAKGVPPAATPLEGRTVIGWDHPAAQTSPIDAPTVAGWDHPAAREAVGRDAAKWERIAALMEAEREASRETHRRAQRGAVIFLGILLALVLFAGLKILLR
jgi:hypothetical protein